MGNTIELDDVLDELEENSAPTNTAIIMTKEAGETIKKTEKLDFVEAHSDTSAIHDDIAGEILNIDEKTATVDDDIIIIEDSENSHNKKRVKKSNFAGGGGGDKEPYVIEINAGSWDRPNSLFAPWEKITGVNGDIFVLNFDETISWRVLNDYLLPTDINPTGIVTFEAICFSNATTPTGTVILGAQFSPRSTNGTETWDSSFLTEVITGTKTLSTQNQLEKITWTGNFNTLGMAGGDYVRLKIYRNISDTENSILRVPYIKISFPRV